MKNSLFIYHSFIYSKKYMLTNERQIECIEKRFARLMYYLYAKHAFSLSVIWIFLWVKNVQLVSLYKAEFL